MHPNRTAEAVSRSYLEIIRATREAAGLTQQEAADRIEMDRANWSVVERGCTLSPGLDKVARMAEAVGLRLVLVPADESPLTVPEMTALARLARWYGDRPRDTALPGVLASAIRKLAPYAVKGASR